MRTIHEFLEKHKLCESKPINLTIKKWVNEKKVDDFLFHSVGGGIIVADLLLGDGLIDQDAIAPEVLAGFKNLMKEKADSLEEVRAIFFEKMNNGEESLAGLINKIQGQLGEDQFVDAVGSAAQLANSGSQEGWDVAIDRGDFNQYVQVKVYNDADEVIERILETNQKVAAGFISGNGEIVERIDFAVNDEIYSEVKSRVEEMGLPNEIFDIGASRESIRLSLDQAGEVVGASPFEDMFSEFLGDTLTAAAIHTAAQGFLYWKGAKTSELAIEDAVYGTAISGVGIGASMLFEAVVISEIETASFFLLGPLGAVCTVGAGMGAKAVFKRLTDRRFTAKRLILDNGQLEKLIHSFSSLKLKQPVVA
jgi:hypothetical protein